MFYALFNVSLTVYSNIYSLSSHSNKTLSLLYGIRSEGRIWAKIYDFRLDHSNYAHSQKALRRNMGALAHSGAPRPMEGLIRPWMVYGLRSS